MPDVHALLGPSSAERWGECPPSARLCENIPETPSPFAQEGTIAHSICESKLRARILKEKNLSAPAPLDDEMERCTDDYADFVEEQYNIALAKTEDAKLFVEQQLEFQEYVPEGFGTSDAVIVSDDTLQVIDFKYGKGVPVDPINNPQLRLYALGAYLALGSVYDFSKVKTTVFQPRIYNVGSEELTVEELLEWAENYIKPRAKLAWEGKGEFKVGSHCRFCKAGATCRARIEEAFKIVDMSDTKPATISDDEIPSILDKLDNAEKWIEAMRKYAESMAISGSKKWPGYKLVESTTRRKIENEVGAHEALIEHGANEEDITTTKLKSLTALEKLFGKKELNEMLKDYIVKPQGVPTLVKETDKRPEYNPIQEAFKEEIE